MATNEPAAYKNLAGGTAIRLLDPCDDQSCQYVQGEQTWDISKDTGGYLQMTGKRWYPTVETLPDGTLIVIGGDKNGGYVNTAAQDNPTYEFFPPTKEGAVDLQFLSDTLPVNLYALTWLLPSGKLFMQAARKTIIYDYKKKQVTNLPDMPYATRVYPASAATAMLPLTPRNNYNPTLLFCGGSATDKWGDDGGPHYNVTAVPADNTCVRITPEGAGTPKYEDDDYQMEGRSMGQFVMLPDGTMWHGNGVAMGTAGYGWDKYSIGQSFGQDPVYMPTIYNPSAPAGSRWNRTGLSPSPNERMYHSTAILLPDSSVLIAGSNPNADFTNEQWRSRTDLELWYPWYYNEQRPSSAGLPKQFSYGGEGFNLTLTDKWAASEDIVKTAKVVLIRGGFNTHAIGFGQRYLELNSTYVIDQSKDNQTTLFVSQLPGDVGPMVFQPGPALAFVVINGIPSHGEMVMVGNGKLGDQPTAANAPLPASTVIPKPEPPKPTLQEQQQNNAAAPETSTKAKEEATLPTSQVLKSGAMPLVSGLTTALFGLVLAPLLL